MTRVRVATNNPVKLKAIEEAFKRYFEGAIVIVPKESESGVPDQPVNDQVFEGAKNRLKALRNSEVFADYLVSCEGGIISFAGHWFNVQVVIVEDHQGNQGFGLSQGYEIPETLVAEAINTSIADVLDRVFKGRGGISVLTNGQMTRGTLIKDGTITALGKVLNSEIW